jgi:hypothetical protein
MCRFWGPEEVRYTQSGGLLDEKAAVLKSRGRDRPAALVLQQRGPFPPSTPNSGSSSPAGPRPVSWWGLPRTHVGGFKITPSKAPAGRVLHLRSSGAPLFLNTVTQITSFSLYHFKILIHSYLNIYFSIYNKTFWYLGWAQRVKMLLTETDQRRDK